MPTLTLYKADGQSNQVEFDGPVTIGRQAAICDVVTRDPKVSRRHCRIEPVAQGWRLTDLSSSNGTWVDHKQVGELLLRDGDQIRLGDTVLRFSTFAAAPKRPADPAHALEIARAAQGGSEIDEYAALKPRPMPRAWERLPVPPDTGFTSAFPRSSPAWLPPLLRQGQKAFPCSVRRGQRPRPA
jgi:predicted component of type VI protein secretion system